MAEQAANDEGMGCLYSGHGSSRCGAGEAGGAKKVKRC